MSETPPRSRSEARQCKPDSSTPPRVAQLVVGDGWPIREAAARFQVSWPTVKRWADRYRTGESMQDRSSRPHRSPNKPSRKTTRRRIQLLLRLPERPVQLAYRVEVAPSTVHLILTAAT